MYLTGILSLFFCIIFFYTLGNRLDDSVYFQKVWIWYKESDLGMDKYKNATDPFQFLNGYFFQNHLYFFKNGKKEKSADYLYEVPPFGKGFLQYQKSGNEVEFFSATGEILWKKTINSYPKSSMDSGNILFTSGDNNLVLITDGSGNELKKIGGRFLTDFSFSKNNILLVFSGGEVYLLGKDGKLEKDLSFATDNLVFLKSSAISPSGVCYGIHLLQDKTDKIVVYKKGNQEYEILLDKVYPHKIYFALNDSCELAVNLQKKIQIYDNDGDSVFSRDKKSGPIYQVAETTGNIFIISDNTEMLLLDAKFGMLETEKINSYPWRVLTISEQEFFVETTDEIIQFSRL